MSSIPSNGFFNKIYAIKKKPNLFDDSFTLYQQQTKKTNKNWFNRMGYILMAVPNKTKISLIWNKMCGRKHTNS